MVALLAQCETGMVSADQAIAVLQSDVKARSVLPDYTNFLTDNQMLRQMLRYSLPTEDTSEK